MKIEFKGVNTMPELYTLTKEIKFEASHQLKNHDGKCARLHGHSWKAVITCQGERLESEPGDPKEGMLIDYADIKKAVKPLVENYLDHHHLNETLEMETPTSERVAHWLFHQLKDVLPLLKSVTVHETCTSSCTYQHVNTGIDFKECLNGQIKTI